MVAGVVTVGVTGVAGFAAAVVVGVAGFAAVVVGAALVSFR